MLKCRMKRGVTGLRPPPGGAHADTIVTSCIERNLPGSPSKDADEIYPSQWQDSTNIFGGSITGHPGSSVVKNPPANAGDIASISGLGRSYGEGNDNPLQGIFLTQGSNLRLLHCRQILYRLNHRGSSQGENHCLSLFFQSRTLVPHNDFI